MVCFNYGHLNFNKRTFEFLKFKLQISQILIKMKIEQIYTGCLSQGAYYIESDGEVAIIDPLREVDTYLERTKNDGATIKYIFETHFHADFVSGHVTLAEKTGAPIVFGPNATTNFPSYIAKDEEVFKLGKSTIKVLHTPGHTMESTCYLLRDETGKDVAIFTGDTLFLGDVGRPDLAQKNSGFNEADLASLLFDSLRNKIMPLSDDITVYPAHGAGSACGKKMMKATQDSLGNQKKVNYALREDMTRDEFIKEVTDGLGAPPAYFPLNVELNQTGYNSIDKVLHSGMQALTVIAFETMAELHDALILDVRSNKEFAEAHIPNSIFIGLDGSFAPWVGELIIDIKQPILIVAPEGRESETITRLARVGFDQTLGYLKGGIQSWKNSGREIDSVQSISAEQLSKKYPEVKDVIFDVRKESEYASEHLISAKNIPLNVLNNSLNSLPKEAIFYVHCAGGYRSMIAISILKARGIHNLIDVAGGFGKLKDADIPKSAFVCPSTL